MPTYKAVYFIGLLLQLASVSWVKDGNKNVKVTLTWLFCCFILCHNRTLQAAKHSEIV